MKNIIVWRISRVLFKKWTWWCYSSLGKAIL